MKVALVHDYIKEFGGAERVLKELAEMYPKAPIYTAFKVNGSSCEREFANRKIVESKLALLLKYGNLFSPLRFLIPLVWRTMDLSEYDLVITSCSAYVARGFGVGEKTKVMAYCHTPPRFLYGFETSIEWQKYWIVRVYAMIVNHFLRLYDFWSAQQVDKWLVNSENVARRVWKFYRKESVVVYPPIEVKALMKVAKEAKKESYFLIVSRLVGAKGLVEAAEAASHLGFKLKIVGEAVGFSSVGEKLKKRKVELLGRVDDQELQKLYAQAKGFIALAKDEDFGMTVVEAQAAGTPVLAFNGGGFKETVIDGETGVLIDGIGAKEIEAGLKRFERIKWEKEIIMNNAKRFDKEVFKKRVTEEVNKLMKNDA